MTRFATIRSIGLIAGLAICASAAFASLSRSIDHATEAIGALIAFAFKAQPDYLLERQVFAAVRTLGAAPARSFRERRLARESDARRRAPLSAAFA